MPLTKFSGLLGTLDNKTPSAPVNPPFNVNFVTQFTNTGIWPCITSSGDTITTYNTSTNCIDVYQRVIATWSLATNISLPANFYCNGHAISKDGNYIVVGGYDGNISMGSPLTAIRFLVYLKTAGIWNLQTNTPISTTAPLSTVQPILGYGIANNGITINLTCDRLCIGYSVLSGSSVTASYVHVFVRSGTSWTQRDIVNVSSVANALNSYCLNDIGDKFVVNGLSGLPPTVNRIYEYSTIFSNWDLEPVAAPSTIWSTSGADQIIGAKMFGDNNLLVSRRYQGPTLFLNDNVNSFFSEPVGSYNTDINQIYSLIINQHDNDYDTTLGSITTIYKFNTVSNVWDKVVLNLNASNINQSSGNNRGCCVSYTSNYFALIYYDRTIGSNVLQIYTV